MLTHENTWVLFIDLQERMITAIGGHEEILRKSCILAKAARLLDLPSVVTRQYPKGLGDTADCLKDALGEHVVSDKMSFSCLGDGNGFDVLMEKHSARKNVIIAGVEAHICVQQTVLDLLRLGLTPYVLADCVGSRNDIDGGTALSRMAQSGAVVTTVESVLFEIMKTAEHPARKEIQSLVK